LYVILVNAFLHLTQNDSGSFGVAFGPTFKAYEPKPNIFGGYIWRANPVYLATQSLANNSQLLTGQ
tara:strand:- start:1987 stop:2184 length:198 start_codon:yes stop_codon:yes gene_type:complete